MFFFKKPDLYLANTDFKKNRVCNELSLRATVKTLYQLSYQ